MDGKHNRLQDLREFVGCLAFVVFYLAAVAVVVAGIFFIIRALVQWILYSH